MKAQEILRLYNNGERNFRGVDIRGQDFQGKDLSGADFTNARIQGANFKKSILRNANFASTLAGINHLAKFLYICSSFLLALALGSLTAFAGINIVLFFGNSTEDKMFLVGLFFISLLVISVLNSLVAKLTSSRTMTLQKFIARSLAVLGLGMCCLVVIFSLLKSGNLSVSLIISGFLTGVICQFLATGISILRSIISILISTPKFSSLSSLLGFIGATIVAFSIGSNSWLLTLPLSFASVVLGDYASRGAIKGDALWSATLRVSIALISIRSTSFYKSVLDYTNFSGAIVKAVDFRDSHQIETNWLGAKYLHFARLEGTILQDPEICDLLVSGQGRRKQYVAKDLKGANLTGFDLCGSNFTESDLSAATLERANLEDANFTKVQALGSKFHLTNLTGACLEAWNIDNTTQLDGAICDYVYLLSPKRERRPNSGIFQPGEFTKLFKEVLDTIDLIFQNGIDWKVFLQTFRRVQVEHEGAELAIQSIENKGDGVVVVKLHAAPNTDKVAVHQLFMSGYQTALKEAEERYRAQLHAKDNEIQYHRQQYSDMQEVVKLLASRPINIDVKATAESKAMQGNDQHQKFNVQGDFIINAQNSVVSLRDISGQVSNQISQLPTNVMSDLPNLKDLLTQLQQAVEADTELDDSEKVEALAEVGELATAAQNPNESVMQKAAKGAMNALKGIAAGLSDASKLASACKELMPLITAAFGLP